MTVCIAAACENGARLVSATDGLLSMGEATGECVPGKMVWYRGWQFMYAGTPANMALVFEELENIGPNDPEAFSRLRIQETVRRSHRKVISRLASFESLNPFDMTMEDFKKDGSTVFGESTHDELIRSISQRGSLLSEQLIVTGWAEHPQSVMVYEVGSGGDWLHTASGFASIGSGSQLAQTMLLLMGQARRLTLAETIFNVACAKFSSEKSSGMDVGQHTTMFVSKMRTAEDGQHLNMQAGAFVSPEDIDILRNLWASHLKPRIPDEARIDITRIAARVRGRKIPIS